jgi:hypothetical protein
MKANLDKFAVANYFKSVVNSTWDWRLIPADWPRDPDNGSLDHGGTALTAARLAAYQLMLADPISVP